MVEDNRTDRISIVIPVLNEGGNISTLLDQLNQLPEEKYGLKIDEVIFVDDGSTDGTQKIIRDYSSRKLNFSVILKERFEKHGTVNAQLYGISQCKNNSVLVMDGDLQHPVQYIPKLFTKYMEGYDLALASRYIKNGSASRKPIHGVISRGAILAAKLMLPKARPLNDPISGFFIFDRRLVNPNIEPNGHNKLSLFILCGSDTISVAEVPYHFVERSKGESKVVTDPFSYLFRYADELLFYRRYRNLKNKTRRAGSASSHKKTAR